MEFAFGISCCKENFNANLLRFKITDVQNDFSLEFIAKSHILAVAVRHVGRYDLDVLPLATEFLLPGCNLASLCEVLSNK